MNTDIVEVAVRTILYEIGENPMREGLIDTPKRVARFWQEFINYDPGNVETTFEAVQVDQMIVVRGIQGWSLCEHHLLPWSFTVAVGYITNESVLGLSKIARVVHKHAHKLQLQERFTNDIALEIGQLCNAKGVGVVVVGQHSCMQMRGVRSPGELVTSCLSGVLRSDATARAEFLSLVREN